MRKNTAIIVSATVIFLALILAYPAAAQTMSVPQTTTTQPKTIPTSPTLIQRPPTVIGPQVGNALISVLDNHGHPVSDAKISMTGNGQSVTQLTSAQGQASFHNIGVGKYSYTARKDGYCSQSASIPLDISMGATAVSKSVLPKYGGAKVNVTYNGIPVPDVDVTAWLGINTSLSKTDVNGSATFSVLPPTTVRFEARKAGYQVDPPYPLVMNIPCGQDRIVPIKFIDPYLPVNVRITRVIVKDPYLGVLAGANVRVTADGIPFSQTTNASGYADFDLPKGKHVFSASKDGYVTNKVDADAAGTLSTYVYITLNKR